jgi:hypothetical protein
MFVVELRRPKTMRADLHPAFVARYERRWLNGCIFILIEGVSWQISIKVRSKRFKSAQIIHRLVLSMYFATMGGFTLQSDG